MTPDQIIDRLYPAGTLRRDIFLRHSTQVADLALALNTRLDRPLDPALVRDAAMLHDIGICLTHAPAIDCHGDASYIEHGHLGAALLRAEGFDERLARVAETHTGTGLAPDVIEMLNLPLPPGDYMPRTELERLVCYADKFYSKSGDMQLKPFARARASIARHGGDALARFDAMAARYGRP